LCKMVARRLLLSVVWGAAAATIDMQELKFGGVVWGGGSKQLPNPNEFRLC